MKHEDRRRELGKMFMDISKYLFTVGIASGVILEKMSLFLGTMFFVIAIASGIMGF